MKDEELAEFEIGVDNPKVYSEGKEVKAEKIDWKAYEEERKKRNLEKEET